MKENEGQDYNSDLQPGVEVTLDWTIQAEELTHVKELRLRGKASVAG